jgi:hypothetical protein
VAIITARHLLPFGLFILNISLIESTKSLLLSASVSGKLAKAQICSIVSNGLSSFKMAKTPAGL